MIAIAQTRKGSGGRATEDSQDFTPESKARRSKIIPWALEYLRA